MRSGSTTARHGVARLFRITGTVQGVGFRPFVKRLADQHGLAGAVRNTSWGVEVLVTGPRRLVDVFERQLVPRAPCLARIESVEARDLEPRVVLGDGAHGPSANATFGSETDLPLGRPERFSIISSESGPGSTFVSPDVATCDRCRHEILDPADRRYRYPFTTCIQCGPRYSIIEALPYDRTRTTMAAFDMCEACRAEYDDPASRRFHAQPNACPACGPITRFTPVADRGAPEARGDHPFPHADDQVGHQALIQAANVMRSGGIVALKGLGGFHLSCDATDASAVRLLRRRKGREQKPFAVMAPDIQEIRRFCHVSVAEEEILSGHEAPVVLLERRTDLRAGTLPEEVAPGIDTLGFFLPYTPLHHLVLAELDRPLIMTSGNLTDEPIAYRDDDAFARLSPLVDGFLTHDRPIHARVDDSVVQTFRGRAYPLRRSRGYAPHPLPLPAATHPLLAVGAHQKNVFGLAADGRIFLSPHVGDLEDLETVRALEAEVDRLIGLFSIRPETVACDLHPDYGSTRFAERFAAARGIPLMAVQHHEAHIASVLADTGHEGPIVGVAYDGAGLGRDGSIWGGEFFTGDLTGFERSAHLEPVPLPGGERAVKEPWRMALALLDHLNAGVPEDAAEGAAAAGCSDARPCEDVLQRALSRLPRGSQWEGLPWRALLPALRRGIGSPPTSSAGRLFDGVAALLGTRHTTAYEGQAAVMLETLARVHFRAEGLPAGDRPPPRYEPPGFRAGGRGLLLASLVGPVLAEIRAGVSPGSIAANFHHRLAWWTAAVAEELAAAAHTEAVALGGGVFQNTLLLELMSRRLEHLGLKPLIHRNVPTNDAGIALGQAALAAHHRV